MFVYITPLFIFACWRWGDWKNWKKYYSTILFMILLDFLTNFITAQYSLWEYAKVLRNHTFNDLFVAFTVFPSTVLLYLPHYPKKHSSQAIYIVLWVFIYTAIEFVAFKTGTMTYYNGWNIIWSVFFLFQMFIVIKLHYQKPMLSWPVALALMFITLYILKLPADTMK